jgi:hypothetical protein
MFDDVPRILDDALRHARDQFLRIISKKLNKEKQKKKKKKTKLKNSIFFLLFFFTFQANLLLMH